MMQNKTVVFLLATILFFSNKTNAQNSFGPIPTKEQLAWHDKELPI
jgi:hypothetical protein